MQNGADAVPQPLLAPALVAAVGGMPGAIGRRHLAPRDTGAHDPEQTLEQASVVQGRAAAGRLLRRQERRDLLPEGIAEGRGPREHGGRRRVSGSPQRMARRPARHMPLTGAGLVLATPV
jgi:hypothetical protein